MKRHAAAVEAFRHAVRLDPNDNDAEPRLKEELDNASTQEKYHLELREAIRNRDPETLEFVGWTQGEFNDAWKCYHLEPLHWDETGVIPATSLEMFNVPN